MDDDLTVAEYTTVRNETIEARKAQQEVVKWTLTAITAIFAAVLAYANPKSSTANATPYLLATGLALPGLVIAATMAWLGELLRIRRAYRFLRLREASEWPQLRDGKELDLAELPIAWHWYNAWYRRQAEGKVQEIGQIGTFAVFFGAMIASLLLFLNVLWPHHFVAHDALWKVLATIGAVLGVLIYGVLCFWILGQRASRPMRGEAAPDWESILDVVDGGRHDPPLSEELAPTRAAPMPPSDTEIGQF